VNYLTVPLTLAHKIKDFSCGKELLDNYLHTQAKQDVKKKLAACFILAGDQDIIKGYYTLSASSIPRNLVPDEMKKKLPPAYVNLPITLLGRLAVDKIFHGQKLGELLLLDALKRSYDTSTTIGSMAVIVDPIDADAERFYAKYEFIYLPGSGRQFIMMDTVVDLFK